jgi:hypothetical protein
MAWNKLHIDDEPNKFCEIVHFLEQWSIGAILNSAPPPNFSADTK